jgi:hypothetical protein
MPLQDIEAPTERPVPKKLDNLEANFPMSKKERINRAINKIGPALNKAGSKALEYNQRFNQKVAEAKVKVAEIQNEINTTMSSISIGGTQPDMETDISQSLREAGLDGSWVPQSRNVRVKAKPKSKGKKPKGKPKKKAQSKNGIFFNKMMDTKMPRF